MKTRDILSSLFFLLIGMLFTAGSFSYPVWDRYGPGPGFFPLVLGLLFSILSLGLLVIRSLERSNAGDTLTPSDSLKFSEIRKTLVYLFLLILLYFCFDRLGSLPALFIFLMIVLAVLNRRPLRLSLLISAASAVLTYVVFVRLLGVALPGGVLQNVIRFY